MSHFNSSLLASSGGAFVLFIVYFFVVILVLAGLWSMFVKADKPGWACIIPFYNYYVLLKIVGRPGWWLILYFIPIVNIVIAIIVLYDLAKSFGKGIGFFFGLFLLPFVFMPILGFGEATYEGPAAATA